ncbi:DUF4900 domain-containing protein [uncultured Deinococcus sp.]|uniref:DUF4900 domain-containing protein n=1 Tax=uncultured Deinococcus sp. TaxID=158789 RepID=UPI003747F2AB
MSLRLRRTEGATLFVVVMVVLLLLSAIMAVTMQIALSSRRGTGEQESTLRAQYAAESSVARAQARMSVLNNLFSNALYNDTQMGIKVPQGANADDVAGLIRNLCNISSLPLASQTVPLCGNAADVNSNVLAGANASTLSTRLGLFTAAINGKLLISDAALAAAGGPAAGSSSSSKQAFWISVFGGGTSQSVGTTLNGMTVEGRVGALISSVWRITGDEYEIHIRVPDLNVRASSSATVRSIEAGPQNVEYVLTLGRPPLAKYALFTNHHFSDATSESGCAAGNSNCARITFTSNTRFTGPVHTNEQFNFQGNPVFRGPVTSAGCVAGSINSDSSGCSSVDPGAYFYSSDFESGTTSPSVLLNDDGSVDNSPSYDGTDRYGNSLTSNPQFSAVATASAPPVKWNANFLQLPGTETGQAAAATSSGIYIDGNASNVSLSVASVTPIIANNTLGAAQKMQQISYTTSAGTVNLAINASGQVYAKTTTGLWFPATSTGGTWKAATLPTAAPGTFNGVMYVNGSVGNLNGPARSPANATTATTDTVGPAIASFMKLTLTTRNDVAITSDLRYEDPPCTDAGVCNNEGAQNIFGIYSTSGDVDIVNKYYCSTGLDCDSYRTRSPATPPNVSIQAVLMAGQGKVTVDGYGAGPERAADRGVVNLVGGIIENYYGAFGKTSGKGYGRNFVYDTRTGKGVLPPSFPTTLNWISDFTTPIKFSTGSQIQQSNSSYKNNTGSN